MEHFRGQQQHGQPALRFDEYGNTVTVGHGITGTHDAGAGGGYGATGTGAQPGYRGGYDAGAQTGTGIHDAGGYGGFATTGTGPGIDGGGGLIVTGHPAGVHHGAGGYGTTGTEVGHGPGGFGTGHTAGHGATGTGVVHGVQPAREEHKTGGILHRSGSSSSSSSSEDDGIGGRRKKKGIKEKIKEKLPGGHKGRTSQQQTTAATGGYDAAHGHTGTAAGTTYPATEGTHEKKGTMDKIKEKLPGGHH